MNSKPNRAERQERPRVLLTRWSVPGSVESAQLNQLCGIWVLVLLLLSVVVMTGFALIQLN